MNKADREIVDRILEQNDYNPVNIISILQDTQDHFHYLPPEIFPYYAQKLDVTEAKIYSVATFFENFSLDPKGEYVIKICDGTACHVRKSIPILEKIREMLNLSGDKHTTDDLLFTVETVSCLGACGLAPVLMVNEQVHGAMTPESTSELIESLKKEGAVHA